MKVFCDTNVLIAAFLTRHSHHLAARPVIERVKARIDEGWLCTHSLAEVYAVLTRLPGCSQVAAPIAWQLIKENAVESFSLVTLTPKDYSRVLKSAAENGIEGGRIYEALLLAAAAKCGADRIYTFNVSHFQSLALGDLRDRISAP